MKKDTSQNTNLSISKSGNDNYLQGSSVLDDFFEAVDSPTVSAVTAFKNSLSLFPEDEGGGFFSIGNEVKPGGRADDIRISFKADNPITSMDTDTAYGFYFVWSLVMGQNSNEALQNALPTVNRVVSFKISQAMSFFKMDWKETADTIIKALDNLNAMHIVVKDGTHKFNVPVCSVGYPEKEEERKNLSHQYKVAFTPEFLELLKNENLAITLLPRKLFQINRKRYRHGFLLMLRICRHWRMNDGKENAYTISVGNLCDAAGFPTPEEIKKSKNRSFKRQLYAPFTREMQGLVDAGLIDLKYESHKKTVSVEKMVNSVSVESFYSHMCVCRPVIGVAMNMREVKAKAITNRRKRAAAKRKAKTETV